MILQMKFVFDLVFKCQGGKGGGRGTKTKDNSTSTSKGSDRNDQQTNAY